MMMQMLMTWDSADWRGGFFFLVFFDDEPTAAVACCFSRFRYWLLDNAAGAGRFLVFDLQELHFKDEV